MTVKKPVKNNQTGMGQSTSTENDGVAYFVFGNSIGILLLIFSGICGKCWAL